MSLCISADTWVVNFPHVHSCRPVQMLWGNEGNMCDTHSVARAGHMKLTGCRGGCQPVHIPLCPCGAQWRQGAQTGVGGAPAAEKEPRRVSWCYGLNCVPQRPWCRPNPSGTVFGGMAFEEVAEVK